MTHELKILEPFAEAVFTRRKTFEVRKNDRGFQAGDHVVFKSIDSCGVHVSHPIDKMEYEITYVLNGFGLENGYVAFGIREVER